MIKDNPALIKAIRERFAHVDACPFQGPRIFFENAGGALTLKSVVETNTALAGIPAYVVWKLPLLFAYWRNPEERWHKTPRED